ncbi:hypothetical protein ACLOJK_018383, partial [Asimina triloba]
MLLPLIEGVGGDSMLEMGRVDVGAVHRFDDEDTIVEVPPWWSRIQHVLRKLLNGSDRPISMSPKMGQTVAMAAALDGDGAPNLVPWRSMEF